jgi:hypothetical protein
MVLRIIWEKISSNITDFTVQRITYYVQREPALAGFFYTSHSYAPTPLFLCSLINYHLINEQPGRIPGTYMPVGTVAPVFS